MTTTQQPVRDTQSMVSGMRPKLVEGEFIFCTTRDERLAERIGDFALARFREDEGISFIIERNQAAEMGFDCSLPMRRIILEVFSSLEGIGLTAAVATALTAHQIPCNMVAAYHHDHVFVPADMAGTAIDILRELQQSATSAGFGR
ncbi:ACT domain-containing protein [Rhizobium sp. S96]|uniref:ACT domain-containing protein n=1 Tax=Rhizobium sp. S96 TaxID=3055140 RepID=UPI0025AAF1FE|nr:ACT domain-containing protein [Rhizobium sp. S96]MDM9622388.1 ACT domain-containing protein [Rhizobium sp. S96]